MIGWPGLVGTNDNMAHGQQQVEQIATHLHEAIFPIVVACNAQIDQITANQQVTLLTIQSCMEGKNETLLKLVSYPPVINTRRYLAACAD